MVSIAFSLNSITSLTNYLILNISQKSEVVKQNKKGGPKSAFNIQKYNKENRPDLASQACSKMLELVEPGSDEYQKFRMYKIEFDKKSNALKKRKK